MRKLTFVTLLLAASASAADGDFAGIVSSATPEATAAGIAILESGGNAVDAAVAVSLTLGVTEPAGSGIAGQTVMLIKEPGNPAIVVQGTTWSPRKIPGNVTVEQLRYGRTAATVPSTLRVLDLAHRRFGSGEINWRRLVLPAIERAERGFRLGAFRGRAFRHYADDLRKDRYAARTFLRTDGSAYRSGDTLKQPKLAATLRRIAESGAMDFYRGAMAAEIADDLAENGGWITLDDLNSFPEPAIVPAIDTTYRGYRVESLPPPFGGWVVLQILNVLEKSAPAALAADDDGRRLAVLDAVRIGQVSRHDAPVTDYADYAGAIRQRLSKSRADELLAAYHAGIGGETTHFSVVDAGGTAVSVTQSIDSYFGAKVMHPALGFLYNNYMQGFQVDDPEAPYYLEGSEMPLSSMSATIVSDAGAPVLVLGSPGSARIISAVAQVTSHWIDVGSGIDSAVSAYRIHAAPEGKAYIEGPEVSVAMLAGVARRGLRLARPAYGVADGHYDPYFGGVHGLAYQNGAWTGAADPRRDGAVAVARSE